MGALVQPIEREAAASSAAGASARISQRLCDLGWVALAVFLLPNIFALGLFEHAAEFFRGWLNVEIGAAFILLLFRRTRYLALGLLSLELIADLAEPFAHVYYFRKSDLLDALRYVTLLPPQRLAAYAVGIVAYVAAAILGFTFVARRVRNRRFVTVAMVTIVTVSSLAELLSGRYSGLLRSDTRVSGVRLVRTPAASLVFRHLSRKKPAPPQHIQSTMEELSTAARASIVQRRLNVLTVLVESWGLFKDNDARTQIASPLMRPEIAERYEIRTGTVPFVGNTLFGESRSVCGEIFATPLEQVSPARLAQCYPAQFERSGYSTMAIHGFYGHMYGRDRWMPMAGFKRLLFGPEMRAMGLRGCPGGLEGVCDSDVADLIQRRLKKQPGSAPEFIHWTSLDSHLPIEITPETLAGTHSVTLPASIARDDALTVWYSKILKLNTRIAAMALDASMPPTVFILVGDHAPPFYGAERRARFSQDHVPYVILVPKPANRTERSGA